MDIDVFYIWGEGGEEKELRREEKRKKMDIEEEERSPVCCEIKNSRFFIWRFTDG